jgi:hypothetical protein
MRHFVVDWNGTISEMIGDSAILRRMAIAIMRDALARSGGRDGGLGAFCTGQYRLPKS